MDQVVVSLKLQDGSTKSLMCSQLLAAAGRKPNTAALDVSAAGIEVDAKGFIKVTPSLQTTAPNIWTLGDIKGGPQFTHISYDVRSHPIPSRPMRSNMMRIYIQQSFHSRPTTAPPYPQL